MIIKTKISSREYRKLLFGLTYKKPVMKLILVVAVALIVWITGYYFHFFPVSRPESYQYITLIFITMVQPCAIYLTIKRNFDSSTQLGEQLEIELNQQEIKVQGESFYTEMRLDKVFKIDERTNWLLIYQNNLSAIIIPKRDFTMAQHEELRQILTTIPNVPVHLNKN